MSHFDLSILKKLGYNHFGQRVFFCFCFLLEREKITEMAIGLSKKQVLSKDIKSEKLYFSQDRTVSLT
jgi:hypothetical protein